jgi:hypothetical protein
MTQKEQLAIITNVSNGKTQMDFLFLMVIIYKCQSDNMN